MAEVWLLLYNEAMSDSLGFIGPKGAFFAKNSDRSCNELQALEWHGPQGGLEGSLKCTYIEIPQVPRTYGILISRPQWMWGAEMGINQHGLCIASEAVYTKGLHSRTGLTGMDLVRLGLERAKSALEACKVMIALLEEHGQGGNCSYDRESLYDSSFLIMDSKELYVLETCAKDWVLKRFDRKALSNRLCIGWDGDSYSGSRCNFASVYSDPLQTFLSGSLERSRITGAFLEKDVKGALTLIEALRCHEGASPFTQAMAKSTCMHAGGLLGNHTTASMAVEMRERSKVVWFTGSSCPCISTYKPYLLGFGDMFPIKDRIAYWKVQEKFSRSLIGKSLPSAFYVQKDELERSWRERMEELLDGLDESQKKASAQAVEKLEELEASKIGKKARKDESAKDQLETMRLELTHQLQAEIKASFRIRLEAFYAQVEREDAQFYESWWNQAAETRRIDPLFRLYWKKKSEALERFEPKD